MTDLTSNDNEPGRARNNARTPEAIGQAALLLVESLLHGMIERSIITTADAVDIIETASEVKEERAAEFGDDKPTMEWSLALLQSIHRSVSSDLSTT